MKIRDALYEYPGTSGPATAHLRVFLHDGMHVAVAGQLTDSTELSITNGAELIFDQLASEYGENVIVVEYYPSDKWSRHIPELEQLTMINRRSAIVRRWHRLWQRSDAKMFGSPRWHPMSRTELEVITGTAVEFWPSAEYTSASLVANGTEPLPPDEPDHRE